MQNTVYIRPLTTAELGEVQTLHAEVFGPGRFARTAYRVREQQRGANKFISPYCHIASFEGRMVASLTMTPIKIGGHDRALLLGPLAVDPDFAGRGFGRATVRTSLDLAQTLGERFVVLVGDAPYYDRFGFKPVAPGTIVFPGPVNPLRILGLELQDGAAKDYRGLVTAA